MANRNGLALLLCRLKVQTLYQALRRWKQFCMIRCGCDKIFHDTRFIDQKKEIDVGFLDQQVFEILRNGEVSHFQWNRSSDFLRRISFL